MRPWLLILLAACDPTAVSDKPPAEDCVNLVDDDEDGFADCADPDCATVCGEECADGIDNDLDGLVDCADDQCDGLCMELCDDERDNDGDGLVDCDDMDCVGSCPEVCGDGLDNDGDGLVDCLDEDCTAPTCAEACEDGRDNDADGLVDCDDPDCVSPVCAEICDDGRDNDGDGRADCDDVDCDGACPEICDDFRDNDADGFVDCLDDECMSLCDADGDGFYNAEYGGDDCDDTRFEINPSRPEICNGAEAYDDDCDGLVDELDPDIDPFTLIGWYPDFDGDGHGNNSEVQFACQQPEGWAAGNLDCDDLRPDVNPDMPEICNVDEPLDDDCDGLVDDADPDVDEDSFLSWYADRDGDGYGSGEDFVFACSRPGDTAASDDDCDDTDPDIGPPSLWLPDTDGDGFGAGDPISDEPTCESPAPDHAPDWRGEDCDDLDPLAYPDAVEICEDGIDQSCDGLDGLCCGHLIIEHVHTETQGQWCDGDALAYIRDYGSMTFDDCQCLANQTGTSWWGGEWTDYPESWLGDHDAALATLAVSSYWTEEELVSRYDLNPCVLATFDHRTESTEAPVEELYTDDLGRRWHFWVLGRQTHSQALSFADEVRGRIINPNSVGRVDETSFTAPTHWCHAGAQFNGPSTLNSDEIGNFYVGYYD